MSPPFPKSWWVEPPMLLAGCYPGSADDCQQRDKLNALLDAGIRCMVNLVEPDEVDWNAKLFVPYQELIEELAAGRGMMIHCVRFPVRDGDVPAPKEMNAILEAIDAAIDQRMPVYVHCWGGHGRTGTVIGCWLVRHGYSGTEALSRINELRKEDPYLRFQPAPQTVEQEDFVTNWPGDDCLGP